MNLSALGGIVISRIIVLIPCYNEELNIGDVVESIKSSAVEVDYIVINDCSTDGVVSRCREKGYNYLDLPVNLGIGGCMQTGYQYAVSKGYDIAIQHDGDGQHDPRFFSEVIAPIESGHADIVIGSRFLDKKGFQSTGMRRMGITLLSMLIHRFCGIKIYDVTSGYRAVNTKYMKRFAAQYAQDYPEPESVMVSALNKAKIVEVPVVMRERVHGKSSIRRWGSLYYMLKVSLAIILSRLIVTRKG